MILQLSPPLPLTSPHGTGLAHFLIDYGPEHNLVWVIFGENREIWSVQNPEVRAVGNMTEGRS